MALGNGSPCSVGRLRRLCAEGRVSDALHASELLAQRETPLPSGVLHWLLKKCITARNHVAGRRVRILMAKIGVSSDFLLVKELVRLFCLTGQLPDAIAEFRKLRLKSRSIWNLIIASHAKHGQGKEAIELYQEMQRGDIIPDICTYTATLKACARTSSIEQGKLIHAQILTSGLKLDVILGNTLVDMYAKCGSMNDAHRLFLEMPKKDVVSWTSLISGYVQNDNGSEALKLFRQMQKEGVMPDTYTYMPILKACAKVGDLEQGKIIHSEILRRGLKLDSFLGNGLIDMYAKCGSIGKACKLFLELSARDLVSWNSLLWGCVHHGQSLKALELFKRMQAEGPKPEKVTYLTILRACASLKALDQGRLIHRELIQGGIVLDLALGNCLVDMYSKCGSLDEARRQFFQLPYRDIVSWTAIINGCIHHGRVRESFELLKEMQKEGIKPDKFTFASILKGCSSLKDLDQGRLVHAQLVESGAEFDLFLGNSLLDMYCKCGSIGEAHDLFGKLVECDIVSWNTLIAGCVQQGQGHLALHLYKKMQKEGPLPDKVTFICILKVCGNFGLLELGKTIHSQIKKDGLERDSVLGNSLVGMYGKCGCIEEAHKVFMKLSNPDVVTWTALIDGHLQQGQAREAVQIFEEMQQNGIKPDRVTFLYILRACASIGSADYGNSIHKKLMELGLDQDLSIANALVDMYAKLGNVFEARCVFVNMSKRDEVSWNAMITGCAQQGNIQEAIKLFQKMQEEGFNPSIVTYILLLRACGRIMALNEGKLVHAHLIRSGLAWGANLGNALVDMYIKCGEVNEAYRVFFHQLPERSIVSWTILIDGCAQIGHAQTALSLFEEMQKEGLMPDGVAYASILKVCASMQDLDQGKLIHEQIINSGVKWDLFLGNALLDMYANCGDIDQAHKVLYQLPDRNVISFNTIITGCVQHGHEDKAFILFDKMKDEGLHPDKTVFVSVLKACANLGALEKGKLLHMQIMESEKQLDLVLGNALVDMYAKCGSIAEACELFLKLPERDVISWTALIDGYAQQGEGQEALHLFKKMQEEGFRPNTVTLRCVLSACSHAGLVDEGYAVFKCMYKSYGITPTLEHYICIVDLLGRAGYLYRAHDVIRSMPFQPNAALWMSLLGSCRTHNNLELGKTSFEAVLKLEPTDAGAYILMSSIYSASGRSKNEGDSERWRITHRMLH